MGFSLPRLHFHLPHVLVPRPWPRVSTPLANVVLPNPPPHNALCSLSARRGSRASLPSRVVSGTFSVVSERLRVLRLFAACV